MSKYSEGLPMLGYHRTKESIIEEREDMEQLGEQLLAKKLFLQEIGEEVPNEAIVHAVKYAQKYGYSSCFEYMNEAFKLLDATYE